MLKSEARAQPRPEPPLESLDPRTGRHRHVVVCFLRTHLPRFRSQASLPDDPVLLQPPCQPPAEVRNPSKSGSYDIRPGADRGRDSSARRARRAQGARATPRTRRPAPRGRALSTARWKLADHRPQAASKVSSRALGPRKRVDSTRGISSESSRKRRKRASSVSKAIRASRRASDAPRQKWMP